MNENDHLLTSMTKLDIPVPPREIFEKALGITNTYNMPIWAIGKINYLRTLKPEDKAEYTDGKTIITVDAYGYLAYCQYPEVREGLFPYIQTKERLFFVVDLDHCNAYIANQDQLFSVLSAQWEDNPEVDRAQRETCDLQSQFELMVNPNKPLTRIEIELEDYGCTEYVENDISIGIVAMQLWYKDTVSAPRKRL